MEELKKRQLQKEKSRQQYEQHVNQKERQRDGFTDYRQWDLWCPSDEDDELIQACAANKPEFKALEKDMEERHRRQGVGFVILS